MSRCTDLRAGVSLKLFESRIKSMVEYSVEKQCRLAYNNQQLIINIMKDVVTVRMVMANSTVGTVRVREMISQFFATMSVFDSMKELAVGIENYGGRLTKFIDMYYGSFIENMPIVIRFVNMIIRLSQIVVERVHKMDLSRESMRDAIAKECCIVSSRGEKSHEYVSELAQKVQKKV